MTPYVCKDPECTEDFTWHLINADPECLFENREAIAAFVRDTGDAIAAFAADESHHVVLYITAEGFEDQKIEIDLIPSSHIPHTTPDEDEVIAEPEPPVDEHEMGHM